MPEFLKKLAMVNSQIKNIDGDMVFFPYLMLRNTQGYLLETTKQKKRAEDLVVTLFLIGIILLILFVSLSSFFRYTLILVFMALPFLIFQPLVRDLQKHSTVISMKELQASAENANSGRFTFVYGLLSVGLGLASVVIYLMYQRFLLISQGDAPTFILFPLIVMVPSSLFFLYKLIRLLSRK